MKLLFLSSMLGGGPLGLRATRLSTAMAERGHDVTVAGIGLRSPRFRIQERIEENVRFIEYPRVGGGRWLGPNLLPWDHVFRLTHVARHRYDVVMTTGHWPNVLFPARMARRLGRAKAVVHDWEDLWHAPNAYRPPSSPIQRALLGAQVRLEPWSVTRADGVTVISKGLEDAALALGVPRERILRFPISARSAPPAAISRQEARKRLGIPPDAFVMAFACNYHVEEEYALVKRTWEEISRERADAHLALTGGGSEDLLARLRREGLVERVQAWGYVPSREELAERYAACDVALMPYPDNRANRCRFPSRITDYATAGLPIVTQSVGDMVDLVGGERAGVALPGDVSTLAPGVRAMFDNTARADASRRSRRLVDTRLDPSSQAKELEAFYERLIADRR